MISIFFVIFIFYGTYAGNIVNLKLCYTDDGIHKHGAQQKCLLTLLESLVISYDQ